MAGHCKKTGFQGLFVVVFSMVNNCLSWIMGLGDVFFYQRVPFLYLLDYILHKPKFLLRQSYNSFSHKVLSLAESTNYLHSGIFIMWTNWKLDGTDFPVVFYQAPKWVHPLVQTKMWHHYCGLHENHSFLNEPLHLYLCIWQRVLSKLNVII